jgi:hypothetical protein
MRFPKFGVLTLKCNFISIDPQKAHPLSKTRRLSHTCLKFGNKVSVTCVKHVEHFKSETWN